MNILRNRLCSSLRLLYLYSKRNRHNCFDRYYTKSHLNELCPYPSVHHRNSGFKNNVVLPTGLVKFRNVHTEVHKLHMAPDEGPASEPESDEVNVIFITSEGEEIKVKAKVGDNVLKLGVKYEVGCEGACDCSLACTTCHMYVDESFEKFTDEMNDQEEDLLDSAVFLKPNSRLTCQIKLKKEMDGIRFTLPQGTVNFYVDGHKPAPH